MLVLVLPCLTSRGLGPHYVSGGERWSSERVLGGRFPVDLVDIAHWYTPSNRALLLYAESYCAPQDTTHLSQRWELWGWDAQRPLREGQRSSETPRGRRARPSPRRAPTGRGPGLVDPPRVTFVGVRGKRKERTHQIPN